MEAHARSRPRESGATDIARVLTEDGLCKELRERGLDRAGRFSWDATARAVQQAVARAVAA